MLVIMLVARITSNICMWVKIMLVTSMELASVLAYARTLKKFNFLRANDARWVNSQRLYTLVEVLRVSDQCCECFIKKQTVWNFCY